MREGVAALIVQQQMILLGKRSAERAFYPNVWDVFGGHVEPDESYEQALQRELYEELGITPIRWEFLTTLAEPDPDQYGPGQYRFYLVTAWSGTPRNRQPHNGLRLTRRCTWIWRTRRMPGFLPLHYQDSLMRDPGIAWWSSSTAPEDFERAGRSGCVGATKPAVCWFSQIRFPT